MSLTLAATVTARDVDVELSVSAGETLALIGANGSGKSTVLEVLAGLLRPDSGQAALDDRELFSIAPPAWLPPHLRRTALLAQEPLLFPHMSVAENVGFGPRSRGCSRGEARGSARRWLAEVGAADLAQRRPTELSGGQAQRVALARALAAEPQLLLLDEPLAALDIDVAADVRQTLSRLLRGRTAIIVTHDVLDAVLLAERVAVMERGRIVEVGATADVMRRPRSSFAASLSGLNLLRGAAVDEYTIRTRDGVIVQGEPEGPFEPEAELIAIFAPSAVSVHRQRPGGSVRNVFVGSITALEPQAHLVRVRVGDLSADVTPASVADLRLGIGDVVQLAVKAAEVSLYRSRGGMAG